MAKFLFQKGNKYGNRFEKGYMPWNKGKKYKCPSISETLKGKKPKNLALLHKLRRAIRWAPCSGKNHPNWKGGITPEVMKIRNSVEMKDWRKKVLKYDDYTCWICKVRGGELQAHHLKRFSDYPKLRFVVSNGLTLCKFCHKTYTKFGLTLFFTFEF